MSRTAMTRPAMTCATSAARCASEVGMFSGVALALSELPLDLMQRRGLARRVHDRGGELEVQFLHRDHERALPVWLDGQLHVLPWGNRRGESRLLPCTGWTRQSTV